MLNVTLTHCSSVSVIPVIGEQSEILIHLSQARSSQLMMIGRQGTFAINLVCPLPSLLDKKTHFTLVPIVFIGTECATVLLTDSQHFTVRNIVGCPAVVLNSNSYHCDVCVV